MTTTTRLPAFVTAGARTVPHPDVSYDGHTVALVHDMSAPCIVRVVATTFNFRITLEGLTNGLECEHVEPFGRITISPAANGNGFRWVVIDIDGRDGSLDAQVWLSAEKVGEFLVDLTLARILSAGADTDTESSRGHLRPNGGAL